MHLCSSQILACSFLFFFFNDFLNYITLVTIQYIPGFQCKEYASLVVYNTQCTMQYMPSLLPITSLSHSPTPLPSEVFSLFLIVHSLSWFIPASVYPPSFFPFFSYRSSDFLCSINERNHMIIVFL